MTLTEIQKKAFQLVSKNDSSVSDYIRTGKELNTAGREVPDYIRPIRVAFLSNFTLLGLPEVFRVRALFHNLWATTYLGPYNQYAQEILDPASQLNKMRPKIIYLLIDLKDADKGQIDNLVNTARNNIGAQVELITDFSDFKEYWYTKYKELGDMRLALEAFPGLAEKLMGAAVSAAGATKKCLVLDLDNTLWSGIVGEDGPEKVAPNKKLQEYILALYKKGTILAINSKNNEADALEVIEKHPDMILRKNHFAAWQINWRDKATNLKALSEELALGTDSFVFVDDDPFQQSLVAESFSEVAVLHPDNLMNYSGFSTAKLTVEDMRRGEMYAEERVRRGLRSSLNSVGDFIKDLNLEVTIREIKADSGIIPRLSQMTQKTNQFNMTTIRWSDQDIRALLALGNRMWAVEAIDRFGDYGTIGFLSVDPKTELGWRIDNFLMSCRILGRGIEKALLARLIEVAGQNKATNLVGVFKPTQKNKALCENFYSENNFLLPGVASVGGTDQHYYFKYDFTNPYPYPENIKVNLA